MQDGLDYLNQPRTRSKPPKLMQASALALGFRFGMVSYADTGFFQHRNIVGAVAHRQHLVRLQTQTATVFAQQIRFGLRVDDFSFQTACQPAVFYFQYVGVVVFEAQTLLQTSVKKVNPPDTNMNFTSCFLHSSNRNSAPGESCSTFS